MSRIGESYNNTINGLGNWKTLFWIGGAGFASAQKICNYRDKLVGAFQLRLAFPNYENFPVCCPQRLNISFIALLITQ